MKNSKTQEIFTIIAGTATVVLAIMAVLQFSFRTKINTPTDLIEALHSIEVAINGTEFNPDRSEINRIENAVDEFSTQIALSVGDKDGELAFVPRSFAGVRKYSDDAVFDFMAANGKTKLIRVIVRTWSVAFLVDGSADEYETSLGGNFVVGFGEISCRFEILALEANKGATIRSTCF
ncbi:MAG: hypothetical protein ACPG5U_10605 [Planktomarina sp.]